MNKSIYCSPCSKAIRAKSHYNISLEEAKKLKDIKQCSACDRTAEEAGVKLVIDHQHDSGRVRDVLCSHCNIALGHLMDDPTRIRKLEMYAVKHRYYHDEQNTLSTN